MANYPSGDKVGFLRHENFPRIEFLRYEDVHLRGAHPQISDVEAQSSMTADKRARMDAERPVTRVVVSLYAVEASVDESDADSFADMRERRAAHSAYEAARHEANGERKPERRSILYAVGVWDDDNGNNSQIAGVRPCVSSVGVWATDSGEFQSLTMAIDAATTLVIRHATERIRARADIRTERRRMAEREQARSDQLAAFWAQARNAAE